MKPFRPSRSGYLVKYALTTGITTADVEDASNPKYVVDVCPWAGCYTRGKEWVETKEEAEELAKQMARRKIASLKKQLAKLEQLTEQPKWAK